MLLLSYRWYSYKKLKHHYFLFDFCYFTTFLILIYLWLPRGISYKGALFPVVFGFSNGPLLAAVVLWKNSIVPHSADKMTSMFIHVSPSITLWGIRWCVMCREVASIVATKCASYNFVVGVTATYSPVYLCSHLEEVVIWKSA